MIKFLVPLTVFIAFTQTTALAQKQTQDETVLQGFVKPASTVSGMAKGNCFFFEDFEGGAIPSGWNVGDQVEQLDANNVGLGTYVDPWVVGNSFDANNNGFLPIPNDPAGNLFAFAGDDGSPCNCDMDSVRLATPEMDLTGLSNMALNLLAYSDAGFNGGNLEISASIDQGATWEHLFTLAPQQGAWQEVFVSLSAYNDTSSLMIGFEWSDNASWATGVAIDNVCISEVLPYNLYLKEPFMADVSGAPNDPSVQSFQYPFLALDQSISTVVGAWVKNVGSLEMTNVVVECEIFQDAISQGTFSSTATASIQPGQEDTILWDTGWMPTSPGDVEFFISVSADSTDQFPGNDSMSISQLVTDDALAQILGRDDNSVEIFKSNNGETFEFGPGFKISNDAEIHGLLVAIGEGAGAPVVGHVYDATLNQLAVTDTVVLGSGDENAIGGNTMVYLPFSTPVDVAAQSYYTATIEHLGGAENVSIGLSGKIPDQSSIFIDEFGAIFNSGTGAPMVRLVMAANSLTIEDLGSGSVILPGNNFPNPFSTSSTIKVELERSTRVVFKVVDMNGKTVIERNEGIVQAGTHLINIDGTKLANGTYVYSIITEEISTSRMMLVSH